MLAWGIGLLWLVGITNAFNLLDNMDGLAATLAAIACAYFAIDAVTEHENETVLVLALALGLACADFLPFNLRPRRGAACSWATPGQVLGFGLARSPRVELDGRRDDGCDDPPTLARLAVPILDTTLVTLKRLARAGPVTQGGRDHTSPARLLRALGGEGGAPARLVAAAIGATALAYNVLDNGRLTALGVLVTFVLLVQFGSFLSDLEERAGARRRGPEPSLWRALVFEPRRLVEVVVDFLVICGSFLAAYSSSSAAPGRSTSARSSSLRCRSCSRRATSSSSRSASTAGCGGSRPPATSSRSRSAARRRRSSPTSSSSRCARSARSRPSRSSSSTRPRTAPRRRVAAALRLLPELQGHRGTAGACSSSAPGPPAGASRASSGRARRRASSGSSTTTRACAGGASSGSASSGARTRRSGRSRARARRRSSSRSPTPRPSGSTRSCGRPRPPGSRAASSAGAQVLGPEPVEASPA